MVNFVIEPQFNYALPTNATMPKQLNLPGHINAQGNYARAANKLLDALLPDLTDQAARPLRVAVLSSSDCSSQPTLPAYQGRPAVDFSQTDSVVARGFAQRWTLEDDGSEGFCAFVVVANLCGAPSSFVLSIKGLPAEISHARHQFDTNYNVTLVNSEITDVVAGYGTSILRFGCAGFTEACDGTGRVC